MAYGSHANAGDRRTIGSFYGYCKAGPPTPQGVSCEDYMLAYARLLGMIGANRERIAPAGICDAEYTSESLRFLFINWAERNPKRWTEDFVFGVDASLKEAWPCK